MIIAGTRDMNEFAQYLYEEIGAASGIELRVMMTAKPELVAAIERAVKRVQANRQAELKEAMDSIKESWATAAANIAKIFEDAQLAATRKADNWKVDYFHDDCPECEACAEEAIKNAKERGTLSEVYNEMVPAAVTGWPTVGHSATVERKF